MASMNRASWGAVALFVTIALFARGADAIFTIEINQGVQSGIPIAIVPFENTSNLAVDEPISQIIRNDLLRSGKFLPLESENFLSTPHAPEKVKFNDWRLVKVDFLVVGTVAPAEAGKLVVNFHLLDVFDESQIAAVRYTIQPSQFRATAHLVANEIFGKVTGNPSSFHSRIAYSVSERVDGAMVHSLIVADYDGYNPQTILQDSVPILSPSWSPDSTRIAYSVLERTQAKIYVQTVATGERRVVAEFDGHNRAPSWSPDGTRLAFSLSKSGNSDIYVLSLQDGSLIRLTDSLSIDTEPSWMPDGQSIVFTSNRPGNPQIYRVGADGKSEPARLTFEGKYNAGAKVASDGKSLVLVSDQGGGNQAALFDIENRFIVTISKSNYDDSPVFSPHGDMVMYILEGADRQLRTLSPDGAIQSRIPVPRGKVKQVSWEIRK